MKFYSHKYILENEVLGKGDGSWQEYTLEELLPLGFSGKNLEK